MHLSRQPMVFKVFLLGRSISRRDGQCVWMSLSGNSFTRKRQTETMTKDESPELHKRVFKVLVITKVLCLGTSFRLSSFIREIRVIRGYFIPAFSSWFALCVLYPFSQDNQGIIRGYSGDALCQLYGCSMRKCMRRVCEAHFRGLTPSI